MNSGPAGFSVDLTELDALAAKADALAKTLRAAWQQDWFSDEKWPDADPLRSAVITYRRSLQAAMDRLGAGADRMSTHLRATADGYRGTDGRAARTFRRMTRPDDEVERADGSAES